ncbi:MAG: N-acetylglucosamine-6-phosphate deacetylase [Mycobacteriales bacterium]
MDVALAGRLPDGRAVRLFGTAGRIAAIEAITAPKDADLPWLVPGLIDIQVNGFGGYDVNAAEPDPAHIVAISRLLAARGVTGWCPTVTTCAPDAALRRIAAVHDALASSPHAAHAVLGIHMEGPWLSPNEGTRGVHPPEHIGPPSVAALDELLAAGSGLIRIVTLSPEWPGAITVIEAIAAAGVVPAIGHTDASPDQIDAAVAAGARLSTHLGNGAPTLLARHPNVIWSQLAADAMAASFIADGHHLPAATLRSMVRAKGQQRCILVSDSTAVAGCPPGRYDTPVGGQVELSADGRLAVAGTPYLAGSAVSLAECVARASRLADVTPAAAVEMASRIPAELLGAAERGSLDVGSAYDVVEIDGAAGPDRHLAVRAVWFDGHRVTGGGT